MVLLHAAAVIAAMAALVAACAYLWDVVHNYED